MKILKPEALIDFNKLLIREMQCEVDLERLSNFDASFSTEFVYHLFTEGMSVEIKKEKLTSPFQKTYSIDSIKQDITKADFAVVAEIEETIAGFATVKCEKWNNRAILTGLFVAPEAKGKGVGRVLTEAAIDYAKDKSVRCLFVETQNINYPAIQFYRKMKFEFCGFDTMLYNPADVSANEIAFYFCKKLSNESS